MREPGVAVTVSEAGDEGVALPPVGEMASQDPPGGEETAAEAVKLSDPPPAFRTRSVWLPASPPWLPVKLKLWVSTPRAGGVGDCTLNETAIAVVAGTAFGTVMVIVPW